MADGRRIAALIRDTHLTREARIMGAHILAMGPGRHEVSTEEWQHLLGPCRGGPPKRQSIAGWAAELERHEYVRKVPGGAGSPRYEVVPQEDCSRPTVPQEDCSPESSTVPQEDIMSPTGTVEPRLQSPRRTVASSLLLLPTTTAASTENAPARVSPDAERVMEERTQVLDGCRGPMADYLAARVDPGRQAAYVWRVVAALEGSDEWMWKDRAGHTLHDGRTGILAGAFNELLLGDETGKHFSEPPGGYANLRTKVRYLVASSLGVDSDVRKAKGPPGGPARPHPAIPANQGSLD